MRKNFKCCRGKLETEIEKSPTSTESVAKRKKVEAVKLCHRESNLGQPLPLASTLPLRHHHCPFLCPILSAMLQFQLEKRFCYNLLEL